MLYTQGNELIRVQCAFVDTPEVEKLTDFIGSQKAYASAHVLPEYIGDESGTSLDIDISDRDKLFREAAEVIVIAQQGSASLLQRKLKLGYNRAGRTDGPIDKENRLLGRYITESVVIENLGNLHFAGTVDGLA